MLRNTFDFNIENTDDIEKLYDDLETFKKIWKKFSLESSEYTVEGREQFKDNFYNSKLNTILSIVNYHVKQQSFKKSNNPFCGLATDELIIYQVKFCDAMAELDLVRIMSDDTATNTFFDISKKIKKYVDMDEDFLLDIALLEEIIGFYDLYLELSENEN